MPELSYNARHEYKKEIQEQVQSGPQSSSQEVEQITLLESVRVEDYDLSVIGTRRCLGLNPRPYEGPIEIFPARWWEEDRFVKGAGGSYVPMAPQIFEHFYTVNGSMLEYRESDNPWRCYTRIFGTTQFQKYFPCKCGRVLWRVSRYGG